MTAFGAVASPLYPVRYCIVKKYGVSVPSHRYAPDSKCRGAIGYKTRFHRKAIGITGMMIC